MNVQVELNYKQRNATRVLTGVFGLCTFLLISENTKASMALGALLALMFRNPKLVYVMTCTVRRDALAITRFISLNVFMMLLDVRGWTVAHTLRHCAHKQPLKTCLILGERSLTFQQVDELSDKVGAYFKARGLRRGDCVALLMEPRLEYICLWLGLSKIGVHTALINSHLRRTTLAHSIKVAQARVLILGTELAGAMTELLEAEDATEELRELPIYQWSDSVQRDAASFKLMTDSIDLAAALQEQPHVDLTADIAAGKPKDKLLYVYTSGTTGMPKAAIITHSRYLFMSSGTFYMLKLRRKDVLYNPLPLYHSAGGIVGVGMALVHGCTVVLRTKFSASNFWRDCIKHECTVAQYIGELCRYLLLTPYQPEEKQHNLRLMYGNGLRPQIWTQFVSRFNIPHIGEVYGSTEGNSNLANLTNRMGAVGFIPLLGRRFYPVQVVRCDEESGEPIRNAAGYCTRCEAGETGLLIGKVDARRANTAFSGYADRAASEQKLLRGVFSKSDVYFNSGDMIVGDLLGYLYFKDRTGDTFRWRGENVATLEVEAIITNVVGLKDCVVFGVEVPHVEGKAGMAVIVDPQRRVDLVHLSAGIRGSLPAYARPLFVRLTDEIPRTATFKMKKRELVENSFHIDRVAPDPIYYLNRDGVYRLLTETQYKELLEGQAGL